MLTWNNRWNIYDNVAWGKTKYQSETRPLSNLGYIKNNKAISECLPLYLIRHMYSPSKRLIDIATDKLRQLR